MHAPSFTVLRRLRRLNSNDLGPKGGMAFAKALESNAAIKELQSAALPLNPLVESAAANHVPTPRVGRGHTLHCPTGGWREVRAPARLRLAANDIGNEAMRAIKTAASTSLELELCQGATIWGSRDPTSMPPSPEKSRRGSTAMPPSPGNSGRYSTVR